MMCVYLILYVLLAGIARSVGQQVAEPLAVHQPLGEAAAPARFEPERQPGSHSLHYQLSNDYTSFTLKFLIVHMCSNVIWAQIWFNSYATNASWTS